MNLTPPVHTVLSSLSCALILGIASCGGQASGNGTEEAEGEGGRSTQQGAGGQESGGEATTGGAPVGRGGAAAGGAAAGGAAAGGTAAGGTAAGGTAAGGTAAGGTAAGGTAAGGTAAGGTAAGGAAAGGASGGTTTTGGAGGEEAGGTTTTGGSGGDGAGGESGSGGEPSWVCGTSRCVPGASCNAETEFCECDPGYEGDGWWCLSTAPCEESPCLNGGTCHPTGIEGQVLCTCPPNWGGVHCESPCSGNLAFPDPALAAAVRQAAMLADGEAITAEAAANINDLGIYEPISDFTGLECLTSVSWVSISQAALTDLSPFAALPRLTSLDARCNPLADLSSIASLINLTRLGLGQDSSCDDETGVTDITPLQGLVGLTSLDLSGHNIESLAPLSSLTRLDYLVLASNANLSSVADLTPLSRLRYLVVTDTQVSDLSPFTGHTALETLWLSGSMVADLTPVVGISSLLELYIVDTPVDCTAQADNLATLKANGVEVSSSCE